MNALQTKFLVFPCIFGLFLISGCASNIQSQPILGDDPYVDDGIVYYMPKRNIRIHVTVATDKQNVNVDEFIHENTIGGIDKNSDTNKITLKNFPAGSSISIDANAKKVTVKNDTIASKSKKTITVDVIDNAGSETYPDLSHPFLLQYSKNWLAKNNIGVSVNRYGILSVTNTKTDSKISEIAGNIATTVAMASLGAGFLPSSPPAPATEANNTGKVTSIFTPLGDNALTFSKEVNDSDCHDGTYKLLFDPLTEKEKVLCGINIEVKPTFTAAKSAEHCNESDTSKDSKSETKCNKPDTLKDSKRLHEQNWTKKLTDSLLKMKIEDNVVENIGGFMSRHFGPSGLFYKQDLPYFVSIKDENSTANYESTLMALSPNASSIYFAPIKKTFFADNTSEISLANGVVSSINLSLDSELLALTSIPADIMGSFTNALGKTLSQLNENSTSAQTNLEAQFGILQALTKIKQCQIAMTTNNPQGKTGDDLSKALANIQTGCKD